MEREKGERDRERNGELKDRVTGYNRSSDEDDDRRRRRDRREREKTRRHENGHRRREVEDRNRDQHRKSERERDRIDDERHRRHRNRDDDGENGRRSEKNEERGDGDRRKVVEDSKPGKTTTGEGKMDNEPGNLGRSGGVYIPPFKLARMMKEVQDKSSVEYQRLTWDALRKSINGLVNKVNATNIKNIIPELFAENLIRGRGLFCRSCMKSQMASPGFTDVFAALVAVVNTKFPEVGDLLLRRIVLQLKRAYKRNDKVCV